MAVTERNRYEDDPYTGDSRPGYGACDGCKEINRLGHDPLNDADLNIHDEQSGSARNHRVQGALTATSVGKSQAPTVQAAGLARPRFLLAWTYQPTFARRGTRVLAFRVKWSTPLIRVRPGFIVNVHCATSLIEHRWGKFEFGHTQAELGPSAQPSATATPRESTRDDPTRRLVFQRRGPAAAVADWERRRCGQLIWLPTVVNHRRSIRGIESFD